MNFTVSDSHCFLLSPQRVESFWNSGYEATQKWIKSYIQNILRWWKLSDIANKHNISIEMVIILSNLCNTYKQLDTGLSQSPILFDTYPQNNIIYIIERFWITSIPELSAYIEASQWSLYLPNTILQSVFSLSSEEEKYDDFKQILEECPRQYIPLAISTYLQHLEWIDQKSQEDFQKVAQGRILCLSEFIKVSSSLSEFIGIFQNELITDIFTQIWEIKFRIIIALCTSVTELIEVIQDQNFVANVGLSNPTQFKAASLLCSNIQELKNVTWNRYLSHPFSGRSNSQVLSDMLQENMEDTDFDELGYFRNRISDFLDSVWISKSSEEVTLGEYELNIYVRLGWTIDHPEIAEVLILFLQEYLDRWWSRIFGKINVVPREVHNKPSEELFTHEKTRFSFSLLMNIFQSYGKS